MYVSPAVGLQYRLDEETFLHQVDTAISCVPSSERYCILAIAASMGWGG